MPQNECRLILMSPASNIMANSKTALVEAFDSGDVAALLVTDQTPGFPPLGDEVLNLARARGIACLKMGNVSPENLEGFEGVHLGCEADARNIRQTRKMLGPQALIGAETGDTRDDAMQRGETGVDYLAFGPQDGEDLPSLELITWWCDLFVVPCVAMGNITLQNAAPLVKAGVDFLMLPASIWSTQDSPGSAIADFNRLIDEANPS